MFFMFAQQVTPNVWFSVINKQYFFLLKPKMHGKDSELESKHSVLFHSECEILHCAGIINLSDRQLLLLGQFALCPQAEGALLCRRLLPVPGGTVELVAGRAAMEGHQTENPK